MKPIDDGRIEKGDLCHVLERRHSYTMHDTMRATCKANYKSDAVWNGYDFGSLGESDKIG